MATAIVNRMAACEPKMNKFALVTLATGSAVAASSTNLQFTRATFYGYKAVSKTAGPTSNDNDAYIGFVDAGNGSGVGPGEPVFVDVVPKGSWIGMTAPLGTKFNLADVKLLGTTGDKVLIQYEQ